MPITSFAIDGVEVNPLVEGFEIQETEGGVSTLVCEILTVGHPTFAVRQTIAVEEDGTKIFAGLISQTRKRGNTAPNLYDTVSGEPEIRTTITAEDHTRLADRVYFTGTVAAGTTRKAFLITLLAGDLGDLGVTLHPSQADGPLLPDLTYERKRVSEILNTIAGEDLWRIDYDTQLRMWSQGELAAPFDIDEDDDPPRWTDDVEVETIIGDEFANRVTVFSGLILDSNHEELFTGDGSAYSFPLEYTLTRITDYRVFVDGVPELLTYQGIGFDLAVQWLYYAVDNTIRRETSGVPDPPANGAVISITFEGTFSASATVEDAASILAHGLYAHEEGPRDDIRTVAAAQTTAEAILAIRLLAGDQIVAYTSRYAAPTLRAGQAQTLTAPARQLSGSYIITDMSVMAETPVTSDFAAAGLGFIRKITAKKNKIGKWQYTYEDWLKVGKGGGSSAVASGSTPVAAGPAPPHTSVQFNNGGAFGGDDAFTYNPVTNSLVMGGGGSSITAANHESCAVIGHNCHIIDP